MNKLEISLGIFLFIISLFLISYTCKIESSKTEKYFDTQQNGFNQGDYNIIYGLYSPFQILGIWLILDGFDVTKEIFKIKIFYSIKKYIKWKIKEGINDYKKFKGNG